MPRIWPIPLERADDSDVEDNIHIPHAHSVFYTPSTNAVQVDPISPQKRQPDTAVGSSAKRGAAEMSTYDFPLDWNPVFEDDHSPPIKKNLLLYVLLLTRSPLIQMLFRMLCEFGPVIPTCQNGQRGIVRNIFKRCSVVKLEDTSGVNLVCKAVNTEKGSIIVRAASGRPCCVWSAAWRWYAGFAAKPIRWQYASPIHD